MSKSAALFGFIFLCWSSLLPFQSARAATEESKVVSAGADLQLAVDELRAVGELGGSKIQDFVAQQATYDRLEKLFRMPEFAKLELDIRWSALALAGRGGTILTFEKPSDVLVKVSSWIPEEVAAYRSSNDHRVSYRMELYGADERWTVESAAFVALWHCMPRNVWLQPERDPYQRVPNGNGTDYRGIVYNNGRPSDFGRCVSEYNGPVNATIDEQFAAQRQSIRKMAGLIAPLLSKKFSNFLKNNRCRGTGPDDCVLILNQWASLAPADPALADMVNSLESEIELARALPELSTAAKLEIPKVNERGFDGNKDRYPDELRFDTEKRREAFLVAKMKSVLGVPTKWKRGALLAVKHQLNVLTMQIYQDNLGQELDRRMDTYKYRYYFNVGSSADSSSREAIKLAASSQFREVAVDELDRLPLNTPCQVFAPWFSISGADWEGNPILHASYLLRRWARGGALRCAEPTPQLWQWLVQGKSQEATSLRTQYIEALNNSRSGSFHEIVINKLTYDGERCFGTKRNSEDEQEASTQQADADPWLRALCDKWVSAPLVAPLALVGNQSALSSSGQFQPTNPQDPTEIAGWLNAQVGKAGLKYRKKVDALIDGLQKHDALWITSAVRWTRPGSSRSLVWLELTNNYEDDFPTPRGYYNDNHLLLVLEPNDMKVVRIPDRLKGDLINVSDLDNDGNLEVWLAIQETGTADSCRGDDSDLERGFDCRATAAAMGEIYGDSLSYFADSRDARRSQLSVPPLLISDEVRQGDKTCNAVLIGSVLGDAMPQGLNFRMRQQEGNVMALTCSIHPQHPDQLLVAAFYELTDAEGNWIGEEGQYGFLVAVLDPGQKKTLSSYRGTVSEDAATRIDEYGLLLDKAVYPVKPNEYALGVIMRTGYSPRCADGSSNSFLWLFVQEETKLVPVLTDLATHRTLMSDNNMCGEGDYTMETTRVGLSASESMTNGYYDLVVNESTDIEYSSARTDVPDKSVHSSKKTGVFRMGDEAYRLESVLH